MGKGAGNTQGKAEGRQPTVCPRSPRAARWHMDRCWGQSAARHRSPGGALGDWVSCGPAGATAPCRLLHPYSPCRGDLKYLLCYQHSPVAARYKSMPRSAARENQIHNAVDGNIELSSLFLSSS